nr:DNA ligase 6 [Tanacetum cinerariifolium]
METEEDSMFLVVIELSQTRKESLQDEIQQKVGVTDARITKVHNELRVSLQKMKGKEFRNWAMMRIVMPTSAHAIIMNSNHERAMESQKEMLQGLSAAVIEAYNMLPNLVSDENEYESSYSVCLADGDSNFDDSIYTTEFLNGLRMSGKEFRNWAMMRIVMPTSAHAIIMNSNHERAMESQKEMLQGLSAAVIEAYNMLPNLVSDHHSLLLKNNELTIDYYCLFS